MSTYEYGISGTAALGEGEGNGRVEVMENVEVNTMPVPLPCPFCDEDVIAYDDPSALYFARPHVAAPGEQYNLRIKDVIAETGYPYVACLCGACGPKAKAPKKNHREGARRAIVAWNRRKPSQMRLAL
jgi:hypothetical protein